MIDDSLVEEIDKSGVMSESAHDLLMLEFLSWIATRRRTYAETMEAWQSTCPRHTIWEDAMIDGYIEFNRQNALRDPEVILTASGVKLLNGKNGTLEYGRKQP